MVSLAPWLIRPYAEVGRSEDKFGKAVGIGKFLRLYVHLCSIYMLHIHFIDLSDFCWDIFFVHQVVEPLGCLEGATVQGFCSDVSGGSLKSWQRRAIRKRGEMRRMALELYRVVMCCVYSLYIQID